MKLIAPACPRGPVDGVDGYLPDQHQWVLGPTYTAPNPEDGQPAAWEDLVCDVCWRVLPTWTHIAPPRYSDAASE